MVHVVIVHVCTIDVVKIVSCDHVLTLNIARQHLNAWLCKASLRLKQI